MQVGFYLLVLAALKGLKIRHVRLLTTKKSTDYFPPLAACGPSSFSLSMNGCGFFGPGGSWVLGEIRCTVHRTINSALLFCRFLLLKKLPKIGMPPNPATLLVTLVTRLSIKPAMTKLCPS